MQLAAGGCRGTLVGQRSDLKTADDALTRTQPGAVPPGTKEAVCSGEKDGGTGVEAYACMAAARLAVVSAQHVGAAPFSL